MTRMNVSLSGSMYRTRDDKLAGLQARCPGDKDSDVAVQGKGR